jgi:hypothetical protein
LAELRIRCFGSDLEGWAACPACSAKIEFHLDARSLAEAPDVAGEPVTVGGETFRIPTSRALALAAHEQQPKAGAIRLLEACRMSGGAAREWSEEEIEAAGERLAAADPLAETVLSLRCPECGHEWEDSLDITAFLWAEVESRAKRLLIEVHELASAYGWPEREILSLSDERRAFYLALVRA